MQKRPPGRRIAGAYDPMSMLEELPAPVIDLIQSGSFSQYATVSAAGVPIDTPVLFFPSEGLRSIDLATGLSYPAKAERARNNPHVGLWIEGGPADPVVSIAGMAAVRDSDLQANVDRYLSEAAYSLAHDPDWSLARQAVWYWTRILVEITPASVVWWDSPAAMDQAPHAWTAPAGTVFPISDPAPPGKTSSPAKWQEKPWQDLAAQALGRGAACHLSVMDEAGFPRPLRVRKIAMSDNGFALDIAAGVPWKMKGKACLTFGGIESFVGKMSGTAGAGVTMTVERTLPIFPMTQDMTQLWEPTDDTRAQLMRRLTEEAQRRGQAIPTIPIERPQPTEGYKRRMARRRIKSGL
jgi:hypothetical protein